MENTKKKILHNRPIFYSFLALLLGITASRYIFQLNSTYLALIITVVVGMVGFLVYFKNFYLILIFISAILLGFCLFYIALNIFEGKSYTGEQTVVGRISTDVSVESDTMEVKLVDVKINGESSKNIIATVENYDNTLTVGDIIIFQTEIGKNNLFSLGSFYLSYYRDNAPYNVSIDIDDITVIGSEIKLDERFKLKVKDLLYESMGSENGATAYAVLFGDTSDITDEVYDAYQDAGILHLLAVSGLNVTFLITLIGYILKFFKVNRWTNFLICFFVLFIYMYLCGFAPSIVRAGIMGIIFLASTLSGRCYDGLNTLGIAGILTLIFSPLSALDVGFLMSYFCVIGIFTIHPVLTKGLQKFLPKFVADSFSISISSLIMILPFMASFYTNLNLLSFFLNLIVVPLFGVIYPILFVACILCVCLPFLSFILVACGWGLSLIVLFANFFAGTSLIVSLKPINVIISALMLITLFGFSRYIMIKRKNRVYALSLSVLVLVSACLIFEGAPIATASSIVYSSRYNREVIVITNSQQKTLVVDGSYFSIINDALNVVNANNVVCHISLNNTLTQSTIEKLNSTYYLYNDNLTVYQGGENILPFFNYEIGGFEVWQVGYDTFYGIGIEFDGIKCFVLYNGCGYNETIAEFIDDYDFDYVFLGQVEDIYADFSEENVITYYKLSNSTQSFEESGSMFFMLQNNNNYKLRRVD